MSIYSTSGLVATTPRHYTTTEGVIITTWRLADNMAFDEATQAWVGTDNTNWFSVICKGQLAVNTAASVAKGDRVIVLGKLLVRDWDNGERAGTSVEIQATSVGCDFAFGVIKASAGYERTN